MDENIKHNYMQLPSEVCIWINKTNNKKYSSDCKKRVAKNTLTDSKLIE